MKSENNPSTEVNINNYEGVINPAISGRQQRALRRAPGKGRGVDRWIHGIHKLRGPGEFQNLSKRRDFEGRMASGDQHAMDLVMAGQETRQGGSGIGAPRTIKRREEAFGILSDQLRERFIAIMDLAIGKRQPEGGMTPLARL